MSMLKFLTPEVSREEVDEALGRLIKARNAYDDALKHWNPGNPICVELGHEWEAAQQEHKRLSQRFFQQVKAKRS